MRQSRDGRVAYSEIESIIAAPSNTTKEDYFRKHIAATRRLLDVDLLLPGSIWGCS